MRRVWLVLSAALLLVLAPRVATAQCNWGPTNFAALQPNTSGALVLPANVTLCAGTYETTQYDIELPAGRTLRVDWGQSVTLRAPNNTIRINGILDATGEGGAGGAGCSTTVGGAGANGTGTSPGQGAGAATTTTTSKGGPGGGGGGHHRDGGAGGYGNNVGLPGQGGAAYAATTLAPGSGGGGGGCSTALVANVTNVGVPGGNGGGAGGFVTLFAKQVLVPANAFVRAGGGVGTQGAIELAGLGRLLGSGGGGGSGGRLRVEATENVAIGGTAAAPSLVASGGAGGAGNWTGLTQRGSGSGGGGSGGRIQILRPLVADADACPATNVNIALGAAGAVNNNQTAYRGSDGLAGEYSCRDNQDPPVIDAITVSAGSINEGGSVTLTATASDPNRHLLKYDFDCDGDGTFEATGVSTNTVTCTFAESRATPYRPNVRVRDWNSIALAVTQPPPGVTAGNYAVGTFAFSPAPIQAPDDKRPSIDVKNVPAVLTVTPPAAGALEGASGTWTLAMQDTPLDLAGRYAVRWEWGDGSPAPANTNLTSPVTTTKTFDDEGTFKVKVTVSDREGGVSTSELEYTVAAVVPTVTLGAFPSNVANNGVVQTFTASATDAPADTAAGFEYRFTFTPPGGGSPINVSASRAPGNASGGSVTQGFTIAGAWTVSVVAVDRNNVQSAAVSRVLNVVDPTQLGGPAITLSPAGPSVAVDEGGSISVGATLVDPLAANNGAPFSWTLSWGDGSTVATGTTAGPSFTTIPAQSHVYADSRAAPATLTLTVTNATGRSTSASLSVTVRNVAPTAVLNGDQSGTEGQAVSFSATASDLSPADRAGSFTYTWNWGDGSPAETQSSGLNATRSHTFADSGTYTVRLTVTDADGSTSGEITARAIVANAVPTASIGGASAGAEGASLDFTSTVNDVSPADRTAGYSYEWDWGDGSAKAGPDRAFSARSHAFRDNGTFTVTLRATDKDGGVGVATRQVTITNAAPTVRIGADRQVARGESVTFAPTVSDAGAADTFTYAWNFGDTTTSTQEKPAKAWNALGTFTVTLTVTDDDRASAADSIVVTVVNRAPVATAAVIAPAQPKSNSDLTLTYAYADADADAESGTSIAWFADGQSVGAFANQKTVPGTATQRGQKWLAEVTPKDGQTAGAVVRSNEVTIGNDEPAATNVVIAPASPVRADALTVTWDYADPDGDAQDGTQIRWTKNGAAQPSLDDQKTVPAPLTKGDRWVATVTAKDGLALGPPSASAPVTVGNTAPVITTLADVAVAASGPQTPVTFTIVASDPDGDTLAYRCTRAGAEVGAAATFTASFAVGTHAVECTVSDGTATVTRTLTVAVGDVPPVVSAGEDVTVDPGRPVLRATARDTLNRPLTYQWEVLRSAEPVTLADPKAAATDFLARKAGAYEFKVTVSNGDKSASDTVLVTIRNVAPFAVITPDVVPNARQFEGVVLDGALSGDPNGDPVTFRWDVVSGGANSFQGGTTGATATYLPQLPGEVVLRLTVRDAELSHSTTAVLRVAPQSPGGNPPIARAGPDQRVLVGETVQLDGSGSFDPDGAQGLAYAWSVRRGPAVTLTNADQPRASFVARSAGDLVLVLSVNDGTFEALDEVTIRVESGGGNARPTAAVVARASALVNDTVELDASGSSDPDGDPLTYRWAWVGGPRVSITGSDTAKASFVALAEGVVEIELVVSDGRVDSVPARVAVVVTKTDNKPPVAVATAPSAAALRALVKLDGTGSSDPEGEALTYVWTQTAGPNVALADAGEAVASFTPEDPGTYAFRLVVSDGFFSSAPVSVSLEVAANQPPVAKARGPADGYVGDRFDFDGSASTDPEGQIRAFRWKLTQGTGTLERPESATPTLVPDRNGTYLLELVVTDDVGQPSTPAAIELVVRNLPELQGGCVGTQAGPLGLSALLGLALVARRRRPGVPRA